MTLRLSSYNVHGFVGTDGVYDVARIAQAIRGLDADGVGLQEVPFERDSKGELSPVSLLAHLPGYRAVCAPVERHDGHVHGNAFVTRATISASEAVNLSFSEREPRTALDVELRVAGQPCRVICTHLGLRPVERRFQVRTLLQHLSTKPAEVTVLLGDFNEWFLAGRPLRWLERHFGRGAALATFPSRFPVAALDRIWVHPRAHLTGYRVPKDRCYRLASDHLPVVAELCWPLPACAP